MHNGCRAVLVFLALALVFAMPAMADTLPANTSPPTIEGLVEIGQTLHANPGAWTGTSPTFVYQWQDCAGGATYSGAVSLDSPAAYWRLGDPVGSAMAYDERNTAAPGTYYGSPGLGASSLLAAPGETSTAVSFDGVNDTVTTPFTNTTSQLAAFSIEAWVKRNGAPSATQQIAGGNGIYLELLPSATAATVTFWNGTAYQTVSTSKTVVDNKAHHLVGSWDGVLLRIYLDGVLSNSVAPVGTPVAGTAAFSIGNFVSGTSWFGGTIDEVAFYRTALTPTRVKAHYDRGSAGCVDIAGATSQDFIIPSTAASHSYRVVVTATNAAGSVAAASARTAVLTLDSPTNDASPSVDGVFSQGQTLTASVGQWSGALPMSFAYAWYRCGFYHEVTGFSPAPISYWRLDDLPGTTSAVDKSGHGNTGTYNNYPTLGVEGALNGDPNAAVGFDGTTESMTAGGAYPTSTGPVSISFWMNWTNPVTGFGADMGLAGYPGFYIQLNHTTKKLQIKTSGGTITASSALSTGSWYHVVAVDPGGGTAALYVNGQAETLSGGPGVGNKTGGQFVIGGGAAGAAYDGTLDEVAVFPTGLTAAQQLALYNAGVAESAPDGCTAITGATSSTYGLQAADEHSKVGVLVTASNSAGAVWAASPIRFVDTPRPTSIDAPVVSGQPATGKTLTVSNGDWAGNPSSWGYQWERCGYRDAVSADQPEGYWRLSDVSQQVVGDETGHNHTGTYANATTGNSALRGDGNQALSDGTATISLAPLTSRASFSIEAWYKPGNDQIGWHQIANAGAWALGINEPGHSSPDGLPYFTVQHDAQTSSTARATVALSPQHWHHLVGVFDGAVAKLYVDGGTPYVGATISTMSTNGGSALSFDAGRASVDEGAYYLSALSQTQVIAHWNAGGNNACTDISGAIGSTYTVTSADSGKRISAIVTATNSQGSAQSASETTLISGSTAPINTRRPLLTNTDQTTRQTTDPTDTTDRVNDHLTTTPGEWIPTNATVTYQWQRCGYPAAIFTDQPVGYWPLDETGGPKAQDATGNNNDGTYVGTPRFAVQGALADSVDSAVRFDGSRAENVSIPNSSSLNVGDGFSLEGWVKVNLLGTGLTLFDKGSDSVIGLPGLNLHVSADGTIVLSQHGGSALVSSAAGALHEDGQWHHIVATSDGTIGQLYVDGALAPNQIHADPYPSIFDTDQPLLIAKGSADYDEFAIYTNALTAPQVTAHYAAGGTPCSTISGQTSSSYLLTSADLTQSVRAKVTATSGGASTTAASGATTPVVQASGLSLDTPRDEATVRTTSPPLSMVAVSSATDYEFELASDTNFTNGLHNSGWLASTPTYPVPAAWRLTDGKTYHWHARVRDSAGVVSPWTSARSFTVRLQLLGIQDYWPMWNLGPLTVNEITGNLVVTPPSPSYPSTLGDIGVGLSYNSLDTSSGPLGQGWVIAAGSSASTPPVELTDWSSVSGELNFASIRWPDGSEEYFDQVGTSNTYVPPPAEPTTLNKNLDGTWFFTDGEGGSFTFSPTDADGHSTVEHADLTTMGPSQPTVTYTYGDPSHLTNIQDDNGRNLQFVWHSINPTSCSDALLCVIGPDNVTWKYYGSSGTSGPLARVSDGTRDVLAITYDSNGRPSTLRNANDLDPTHASPGFNAAHSVTIVYDATGKVSSITDGPNSDQTPSSAVWTFGYHPGSTVTAPTHAAHTGVAAGATRPADGYTTVEPPSQQGLANPAVLKTFYDDLNHGIQVIDLNGNVQQTGYTTKDRVLWKEDGDGNPTDSSFDAFTDALTAITGPDPDGAGPRQRPVARVRFDEAVLGTAATPGAPETGLKAYYYDNVNLSGAPAVVREDTNIAFDWGVGGPAVLNGQADAFAVRWIGAINAPSTGDYSFTLNADHGGTVTIDNYDAIDSWSAGSTASQVLHLKQGLHHISVNYHHTAGSAHVHLSWSCHTCDAPIPFADIPNADFRPLWLLKTSDVSATGTIAFQHFARPAVGAPDYTLVSAGGSNLITSYVYDSYGRVLKKIAPKGNASKSIDANGTLSGATDDRFATVYSYYQPAETVALPSECGPASTVLEPGAIKSAEPYGIAPQTFFYNSAGRMVAESTPTGVSCLTYDAEGRLSKRTSGASTITYAYDPSGNQRVVTAGASSDTIAYDESNRVESAIDASGTQSTFSYDASGDLLAKSVTPTGSTTTYTTSFGYDSEGHAIWVRDPAGRQYSYWYDVGGTVHAVGLWNGTFTWIDRNADGTVKDVFNRHGTLPASLPGTAPADSSPIADFSYTYYDDMKVSSETRTVGTASKTTSFSYDGAGRLTSAAVAGVSTRTFTYDLDSNRQTIVDTPSGGTAQTTATYSYVPGQTPGVDQLTSVTQAGATRTFAYSADGRTTARGADTLNWDDWSRISGGTFGGSLVAYSYEPIGRIRSRTNGSTATNYLYAGASSSPAFETDSSGQKITSSPIDGPLGTVAVYQGPPNLASVIRLEYYNGHGDLVAETSATAAVLATYDYDAFGMLTSGAGPDGLAHRWLGGKAKNFDQTASVILMGARPYDPVLGRFLSVDPIDDGSGTGLYDYAGQDPINKFDLSGESPDLPELTPYYPKIRWFDWRQRGPHRDWAWRNVQRSFHANGGKYGFTTIGAWLSMINRAVRDGGIFELHLENGLYVWGFFLSGFRDYQVGDDHPFMIVFVLRDQTHQFVDAFFSNSDSLFDYYYKLAHNWDCAHVASNELRAC